MLLQFKKTGNQYEPIIQEMTLLEPSEGFDSEGFKTNQNHTVKYEFNLDEFMFDDTTVNQVQALLQKQVDDFEMGSGVVSEADNEHPSAAENYFSAYHTPNFHHKYQLLPALQAKQRPNFGERYIPRQSQNLTLISQHLHLSSVETNKHSLIT